MNKFKQVSSDDRQMSLAMEWVCPGGWVCPEVGMSRGGGNSGGTLPRDPFHDACDVTYPLVDSQMAVKTLPSRNYHCGR